MYVLVSVCMYVRVYLLIVQFVFTRGFQEQDMNECLCVREQLLKYQYQAYSHGRGAFKTTHVVVPVQVSTFIEPDACAASACCSSFVQQAEAEAGAPWSVLSALACPKIDLRAP